MRNPAQTRRIQALKNPEPDFRALFEKAPGLCLVLTPDPEFVIIAVSDAYARATLTRRDEILGRGFFEIFPDNPGDPAAAGAANLRVSLERVLRSRAPDAMAVQRYDIRRPVSEGGGFVARYWNPVNTPVLDPRGEVTAIIHQVDDVTENMRPALHRTEQDPAVEALKSQAVAMRDEISSRSQQLDEVNELLHSQEARFRLIVESVKDYGIFMLDPKGLVSTWNGGAERIKGYTAEEIVGSHFSRFYPREDVLAGKPEMELRVAAAVGRFEDEGWRVRKDGSMFWANVVISAIRAPGGRLVGFSKVTRDLSERKQAEELRLKLTREQATLEERKREAQRSSFLAEASTVLASSLDFHQTLRDLARLAVPAVADWCTVTILRADRMKDRVAAVHADPGKAALIEELARYYPANADEDAGIGQAIRTGKPVLTREVTDSELVGAAQDDRHLAIMRELGCRSCMLVPIVLRGKALGAIAFVSSGVERKYDESDLAVAEELGRRAAIAIDNASLYEAAQAAIRTRDEFMSIASHGELKTPLTSLKLQVQMARRAVKPEQNLAPVPEKLAKDLSVFEHQIDRLTTLVEDLLDVAKIQAGKLSFHLEDVNLSELVRDVTERLSEEAGAAGCPIELRIVDFGIIGSWDRGRIEQAILNLLTNAIKYAPGKPIIVTVASDGRKASLVVQDFGPGIPDDKHDKVFEKFERATPSRNISGLGLGLFIVRKIVIAHQGSIRVESKMSQGARFIVELPLRQAATRAR